jgi:serine/threonine-protein kinase
VDEGSEVEVRVSQGPEEVEVPDVLGQSEQSAIDELETAGFEVSSSEAPSNDTPAGLVSAQNPGPGELAAKGSTVQITISTGPELATVPDVVGETAGDARAMLQDAGFRPRTIFQDVTDPLQEGVVLDQDPSGNSQARPGTTVTIVVGRLV